MTRLLAETPMKRDVRPTTLGAIADRVLAPTYPPAGGRLFVDGSGCHLVDAAGDTYLDMTSGIGVLALGHRSQVVADALREASSALVHTSNLFHTPPAIELADELVRHSFADRVFFGNSGAEAVEAAIKFARLRSGPTRRGIVYFSQSFHGRTVGALAATDNPAARAPFGPLPEGYELAPWNDERSFAAITGATSAVILEPVQGEGGVRPVDPAWLRDLRRRCDAMGALLVFDEVQCGLGRTGALWAHEHAGVHPDLMTLAKPLAGGLPIGAVLMTEHVAAAIAPGCHGSTFGGGPAVAAVARAVFRTINDEAFLAEVRRKGKLLRDALEAIDAPVIRDVRGIGLMLGVHVDTAASRIVETAAAQRLLLTTARDDTVRFLPPLVASDDDLHEAVHRFSKVLERL